MAPKKSTSTKRRKKEPAIKAKPPASSVPAARKEMLAKLNDQKAHFSETIKRREDNLRNLDRAVAALKIHLGTLQDIATSNEGLIAEVEKDMQGKDERLTDNPVKQEKKRTTRSRAKKESA